MKLPVWVSWTLDEHEPKLRSGESIRSALEKLADAGLLPKDGGSGGAVVACMFNCTSPEVITVALRCVQPQRLLVHVRCCCCCCCCC
jgi:S-methylmethionine-dependent homocysteine/selenocysteine methylase